MTYKEISDALNASLLATMEVSEKAGMTTDDESNKLYKKLDILVKLANKAMEDLEMREAYL